jgi:hypothetical protein
LASTAEETGGQSQGRGWVAPARVEGEGGQHWLESGERVGGDRSLWRGSRPTVAAEPHGWPVWRRLVAQTDVGGPRLETVVARVAPMCGRAAAAVA